MPDFADMKSVLDVKNKPVVLACALLAAAVVSALLYLKFGGGVSGLALGVALSVIAFSIGSLDLHHALRIGRADAGRRVLPPALLDLLDAQLVSPGKDMEQVRGLISNAAGQLAISFSDLSEMIHSQQGSLRQILNEIKGEDGTRLADSVTITSLAHEMVGTSALLGRFVRMVVGISKQSMDLYYCVEDVSEHLKGVNRLVGDVNTIAYQTTILALNAAIEAARAGEAGACFQVVAGEVRSLAERSREVSEQITDTVEKAAKAVSSAQAITERNASQDLGVLLTSKLRIDSLGAGIERLDQTLRGNSIRFLTSQRKSLLKLPCQSRVCSLKIFRARS